MEVDVDGVTTYGFVDLEGVDVSFFVEGKVLVLDVAFGDGLDGRFFDSLCVDVKLLVLDVAFGYGSDGSLLDSLLSDWLFGYSVLYSFRWCNVKDPKWLRGMICIICLMSSGFSAFFNALISLT